MVIATHARGQYAQGLQAKTQRDDTNKASMTEIDGQQTSNMIK